ncbi:hypothetical protein ACJ73_02894 [Blastomyces percursus]|uniref:Uncharacterized protein n=1 Tax=Blastomyces percursus TaxID=1658174 RepID=A0A1J9QB19_9EURO|nr:hypothetical protein ACJ73_02894 [Blastomyces percursus]
MDNFVQGKLSITLKILQYFSLNSLPRHGPWVSRHRDDEGQYLASVCFRLDQAEPLLGPHSVFRLGYVLADKLAAVRLGEDDDNDEDEMRTR